MQCNTAFVAPLPLPLSIPSTTHHLLNRTPLPSTKPLTRHSPLCSANLSHRHPQHDPQHDQWAPENLGFLHIATITGPHGVKGEVKARAIGDFEALRLGPGVHIKDRYLLLPGRKYPRPCKVLAGRRASQSSTWILKLDGVNSPEKVKKLRGAQLFAKESDRPRLAYNEYMIGDLVGCRVSLRISPTDQPPWYETVRRDVLYTAAHPIGIVDGVITRDDLCKASGAGPGSAAVAADLLEIALFEMDHTAAFEDTVEAIPEEAERVLVPFVAEIVPVVDIKRATIVLDPPADLLSTTVVNRKEKRQPPRGLLMPADD